MTVRRLVLVLCCLLATALLPASPQQGERRLVLAAGATTTVPPLTLGELRRAYLGMPVEKDGVRIVPLLNAGDPVLYQVFLQKIMFMSAPAYERRRLSGTLQGGGQRLREYETPGGLAAALLATPGAVTYMWAETVQATPGLREVQTLWRGRVE